MSMTITSSGIRFPSLNEVRRDCRICVRQKVGISTAMVPNLGPAPEQGVTSGPPTESDTHRSGTIRFGTIPFALVLPGLYFNSTKFQHPASR